MNKEKEATRFIEQYIARTSINLSRVESLIKLAGEYRSHNANPVYKEDLLRAAVVLLHATLEDCLRFFGSVCLPYCGEGVLDSIPLVGTPELQRGQKFNLGRLVQHRGKTIDHVITESVEAHLDRISFSNTSEIASLLQSLKVDIKLVDTYFPKLDELIKRRHQIVHKADLVESPGAVLIPSLLEAKAIDEATVTEWRTVVSAFISNVFSQHLIHGHYSSDTIRK